MHLVWSSMHFLNAKFNAYIYPLFSNLMHILYNSMPPLFGAVCSTYINVVDILMVNKIKKTKSYSFLLTWKLCHFLYFALVLNTPKNQQVCQHWNSSQLKTKSKMRLKYWACSINEWQSSMKFSQVIRISIKTNWSFKGTFTQT